MPVEVTRFATYGTLSPGRMNHHLLSGLRGRWHEGTVNGTRYESGWGAALGYPGLVLDPMGPAVGVHVFESQELEEHWARLDEFEGPGYQRTLTTVSTTGGEVSAYIYELSAQGRSSTSV